MPTQHNPSREPFGLLIPRDLLLQVKKYALTIDQSVPETVFEILKERVGSFALTPADTKAIELATNFARANNQRIATTRFMGGEAEAEDEFLAEPFPRSKPAKRGSVRKSGGKATAKSIKPADPATEPPKPSSV